MAWVERAKPLGGAREIVKIPKIYLTPTRTGIGITSNGSITLDSNNAKKLTIEKINSQYGTFGVGIYGDNKMLASYSAVTSNIEIDVTEYNVINITVTCTNTNDYYSGVTINNLVME